MDRMSPQDSAFLDSEDENPATSFHIGCVAILDGPAPSYENVVAAFAAKLPLVPRYRQKVRFLPFDLGPPVWVDDPGFDIGNHVRHTALPAPGDDEQLRTLVGRLMSRRLDRRRPLWENWVVEGLAGGRWALVLKTHHCMVDGVSGSTLLDTFLDDAPAPPVPHPHPGDTWQAPARAHHPGAVRGGLVDAGPQPRAPGPYAGSGTAEPAPAGHARARHEPGTGHDGVGDTSGGRLLAVRAHRT